MSLFKTKPLHSAHAEPMHGAAQDFDENDPHHDTHHEHVIVSAFTNRLVLGILLVFTVLTVGAANLETWIDHTFHIHLPTWLNVFVCLFIATIKGALVVLYFMQLRYDNPINGLIFCFSLFGLALFLGFTAIDLGNRAKFYDFKQGEIIHGGNGVVGLDARTVLGDIEKDRKFGESMVEYRRRQKIEELTEEFKKHGDADDVAKQKGLAEYNRLQAEAIHHRRGGHDEEESDSSSSKQSRPRTGATPGLFDAKAPAAEPAHGEH